MLGQRIRLLRKERELSQSALALRMGVTQQAIGKWETGKSTPDYHVLVKLARALGIEPDQLFDPADFSPAVGPQKRREEDSRESARRRWIEEMGIAPGASFKQEMVPVLGVVRAGYGLPADEEEMGWEPASVKDPSQYFYLVVQGDSMEPGIRDKDLALVRKQPALEDGDIGVVVYGDGEGTIKRYHKKGDTVALQAFNPAYETLILAGAELEKLFIIGKVMETKTRW